MRSILIGATVLFIFPAAAQACTAGGVPCDQVYREQLENIDKNRTDNLRRQEQIEQEQHQNNLARARRNQDILDAQRTGTRPAIAPNPSQPQPTSNAGMPAECKAFPAMCSAYK